MKDVLDPEFLPVLLKKVAYPTPHINAVPEDFAKTVLMPGDPLRSEFIAKKYLEDAKLVNNVRGVQGYTGYYKGKKVSVMASGMGMPSMAIYSYELFNAYDVDNIIRIGTAGGIANNVKLRDIVVAMGCTTNTNYIHQFDLPGDFDAEELSRDIQATMDAQKSEKEKETLVNNIRSDSVTDEELNKLADGYIKAGKIEPGEYDRETLKSKVLDSIVEEYKSTDVKENTTGRTL